MLGRSACINVLGPAGPRRNVHLNASSVLGLQSRACQGCAQSLMQIQQRAREPLPLPVKGGADDQAQHAC